MDGFVAIGAVVKAVGLRGEVKLYPLIDFWDDLLGSRFTVWDDGSPAPVVRHRPAKSPRKTPHSVNWNQPSKAGLRHLPARRRVLARTRGAGRSHRARDDHDVGVADLVERVQPAVVNVSVKGTRAQPTAMQMPQIRRPGMMPAAKSPAMETPMIELLASDEQRKFGRDKLDTLPRYCRECEVRFACHGGCPKNRFVTTPKGEDGLNYLCAGYKIFFNHVDLPMRIMTSMLRQNRAPSEVMRLLPLEEARLQPAFAKAKRDEPCPCDSGRQFMRCHGRTVRGGT